MKKGKGKTTPKSIKRYERKRKRFGQYPPSKGRHRIEKANAKKGPGKGKERNSPPQTFAQKKPSSKRPGLKAGQTRGGKGEKKDHVTWPTPPWQKKKKGGAQKNRQRGKLGKKKRVPGYELTEKKNKDPKEHHRGNVRKVLGRQLAQIDVPHRTEGNDAKGGGGKVPTNTSDV